MSDAPAPMTRRRIETLDALILAVERRDEVLRVASECSDEAEAADSVARLLGIRQEHGATVLGLRFGSVTREGAADLRQQREALQQRYAADA